MPRDGATVTWNPFGRPAQPFHVDDEVDDDDGDVYDDIDDDNDDDAEL